MFLSDDLTTQMGTFALVPQIVRAVRSRRQLGPISPAAPAFHLASVAIMPLRLKAESQGSGDFSPLWSGQNATGCKNIAAAELTRELTAGSFR